MKDNIMSERELFDIVKNEPTEISLEKVNKMVATFPLVPAPFDWSSIINLNSIIMTSVTAFILAGSFMLYSGDSNQQTLQTNSYQIVPDTEVTKEIQTPVINNDVPEPMTQESEPEPIAEETPIEEVAPVANSEPESEPTPPQEEEIAVEVHVHPINHLTATKPTVLLEEEMNMPPLPSKMADGRKDFTVGSFHSVELSGSWDMIITQGNEHSVWAEGDEDLLAKLEVEERSSGQIKIHTKKMKNSEYKKCNNGDITIHVTMPIFEEIGVSGSGDVEIGDFNNLEDIEMHIAGSGQIRAEGNLTISGSSEYHIAGSGDMNIDGSSPSVEIHIAGSGDFKGSDLRAQNAEIHIAGSGDVSIHCTEELDVSIAGSGDVSYVGNPKISRSVAGSGSIHPVQ